MEGMLARNPILLSDTSIYPPVSFIISRPVVRTEPAMEEEATTLEVDTGGKCLQSYAIPSSSLLAIAVLNLIISVADAIVIATTETAIEEATPVEGSEPTAGIPRNVATEKLVGGAAMIMEAKGKVAALIVATKTEDTNEETSSMVTTRRSDPLTDFIVAEITSGAPTKEETIIIVKVEE
jgi:hypothetical protein